MSIGMGPPSSGVPLSSGCMAPPFNGGNVPYKMGNMGNVVVPSQGVPAMKIPMHSYMNQFGRGYYPID